MNNNEISNEVFSNYGTLLAKVSDLKKILRILIKNKITLAYQQDTVYANSIDNLNQKDELENLKKMNLKIEGDKGFTYLKVHWNEIKSLAQQGYFKDVSNSLWNILGKGK